MKLVKGVGTLVAPNKVEVKGEKGTEIINTKNILLATGSEVTPFPGVTVSEVAVLTNRFLVERLQPELHPLWVFWVLLY